MYSAVAGYLSCPCYLEGSLFTQVGAGVTEDDSMPDVEMRLLNTLVGSSLEAMSQFVQISNINAQVAVVSASCKLNCIVAVVNTNVLEITVKQR